MALKPYRQFNGPDTAIDFFMNVTGERGLMTIFSGDGGEGDLDDPDNLVAIGTGQAVTGTTPAGLLMCDVVDIDLMRQHLNFHQDQVQVGSKVWLLRKGRVKTNMVADGDTPVAGDPAHYNTTGLLTTTTTSEQIGTFMGQLDDEGYVKVEINVN